jgi:hypothetical protein
LVPTAATLSLWLHHVRESHSGKIFLSPNEIKLMAQAKNVENLDESYYGDAAGPLEQNVGGLLDSGPLRHFALRPTTPQPARPHP